MLMLLVIFLQFTSYYQHNWGKMSYYPAYIWSDYDEDNHLDLQLNYEDSVVLYKLPSNQRLAKYDASSYENVYYILTSYCFGGQRFLVYRYSYNDVSYIYTSKVYYYENYTSLVWSSPEFISYDYNIGFYPNVLDITGDGKDDFYISCKNSDSTVTIIIYQGSIAKEESGTGKGLEVSSGINSIQIFLPKAGKFDIDFYDTAGRSAGTYYLNGRQGENIIVPPFMANGVAFYEVKEAGNVLFKGKVVLLK